MSYTLGLDVGSNSVGWAAISESDGKLLGMGVRVFPEGVDRDTRGAEHSKNEGRRIARGHRRQIARRARRKSAVRRALREAGFWADATDAAVVTTDPYTLRAKGLDEKLTLPELGRVLLHLAQRRGFLSNRKADRGQRTENSETLQQISALAVAIEQSGSRTLGEYLHRVGTGEIQVADHHQRGWHTRRDMFEHEFNRLWDKQREFHPDTLTDDLKYGRRGPQVYPRDPRPLPRHGGRTLLQEFGFHGLLFFQRSLYWPKSVVGRCELEPREKRCERADRRAQRFRLLNEVNNLRIIPQKGDVRELTPDERQTLIAFLSKTKAADFDRLRKELDLFEGDVFNLEAGSRKKLDGAPIDHALAGKKLFGKDWWTRSDAERNAIVRSLLDDEEPEILTNATTAWGCDPELTEALARIDLTALVPGYSSLSITAIEKLLPHLEQGLPMMTRDGTPSALAAAGYLRPDQRKVGQGKLLPLPSDKIANPLVRQALFEVRKVVHAVIREWGTPQAIHIELAREVQGSAIKRAEATQKMRDRERQRSLAADFIRHQGFTPSREAIDRCLLWTEQGEVCLYSGLPISPRQLLEGEADIDHILPYSRTLDDSLMNKVVCFRDENRKKGDRTVREWLEETQPQKYDAILQRARAFPYDIRSRKVLKLKTKEVVLDKFLARQLTDTAYITTQVLDLLKHLQGVDVVPVKGQLTAELRHMWGLNTVLRDDELNLKNREDHRHHAVDALVIALTNRSRLQKLAAIRGTDEQLPIPFTNFRDAVEEVVAGIKVSHKAVRDIAGALHEETIYGPTSKPHRAAADDPRPHAAGWIEQEGQFVVRKKLENLSLNEVVNIRDPQVKALVVERLKQFGVTAGRKKRGAADDDDTADPAKGKIPKEAWNEPLLLVRKGARKSSRPNIIKKVRIVRPELTIRPIRGGTAWVKPGNTHHVAIFELPAQAGKKPKRDMVAVSMMDAAQRASRGEPLVSRVHPQIPEAKFLFSLSWGEMVSANIRGRDDLFVYRTAASTQGQIYFVSHNDARPSASAQKFAVKANTLDGVKVTVDPLGRIRNAND
jgi:CRISPR-associated endonuclease Csn1